MDRDTVRMILLVLGAIVIAGVYVWGRYKEKLLDFLNRRGEYDELDYGDEESNAMTPEDEEDEFEHGRGVGKHTEAFRVIAEEAVHDEHFAAVMAKPPAEPEKPVPAPAPSKTVSLGAPFLIQMSVVTGDDSFFNGEELRDALLELDLIHGDMGIYHRYDRNYREPLFSVASLVEPGTFPEGNMEHFDCPGVVLFFQPPLVAEPLEVFEDLVNTCHELAAKLDGLEWDDKRQPLTREKIALMRARLEEAY